jgi:hypothetical protein
MCERQRGKRAQRRRGKGGKGREGGDSIPACGQKMPLSVTAVRGK